MRCLYTSKLTNSWKNLLRTIESFMIKTKVIPTFGIN